MENEKSIEELIKEREELLKTIEDLKNKNSGNTEINGLKKENEELKKLVENYKNDIQAAVKFSQQVMLEYDSRSKEEEKEEKTEQQIELEKANEKLKQIFEYGKEGK